MTHFEAPGDLRTLGPSADDFLQGTASQEDPDEGSSGEVRLYQAVVARVWDDAWMASNTWIKATDRTCDPTIIRAEARRWFLLDFGEWRRDREDVCLMANLDPDAVRKAAVKRLELAHAEDQERNRLERERIDWCFAALMAREHRMERGVVTRTIRELAIREACL